MTDFGVWRVMGRERVGCWAALSGIESAAQTEAAGGTCSGVRWNMTYG